MTEFKDLELSVLESFGGFKSSIPEVARALRTLDSLFEYYCPFKVGDTVELTSSLGGDKYSGWYAYRHILKPGTCGKVLERKWWDDTFKFLVSIEIPTVMRADGTLLPHSDRVANFYIAAQHLRSPVDSPLFY